MPHSGWGSRLASREGRPQIGLTSCRRWGSVTLVLSYPLLNVVVSTPIVQLRGATDDLLDQLAPLVREGKTDADPPPYDDPTSLYEKDPELRVQKWLRGIWRGRGRVDADFWRLYFAVFLDGRAVGMQDLVGDKFSTYGTVTTFSWLSSDVRRRGLGREMREAILHLAFEGLGTSEAISEAFMDNAGSNGVSRALGYEPNGTTWDTRRGEPERIRCWRLTRDTWESRRREDIEIDGVDACRAILTPSLTTPP